MKPIIDVIGSYREIYTTGLTTTIAAGGVLGTMRWQSSLISYRLRRLQVEAFVKTAFGAAQEVGYELFLARSYTVSASAGTARTPLGANDAKKLAAYPSSVLATAGDLRVASAAAVTAGTRTLDGRSIAKGSFDAAAIRNRLGPIVHDFMYGRDEEPGGEFIGNNEGWELQNLILMGATGVVEWRLTFDWDECLVTV